ncbi:MAG: carbohydrate-binding domain-containing protein [Clostridiales bacterium]|nr:carbohydrate-binding domain-containing protein [Clostridiales bacterium]
MSFKKIICALCCAALCVTSCIACSPTVSPDRGRPNNPSSSGNIGGDIPDNNDVDIPEIDTAAHNFALIAQSNGVFTYKCSHCNKQETVTITCESGTQNAYAVDGNTITFETVTEKSAYNISGSLHGNIVIDAGDCKFELSMSGFSVSSDTDCPVTIESGDKVTLSAKKSTQNYIFDLREEAGESDISPAVYAKCDLDIQGKGSLFVKSVNNNGIHTKKDLNVKNLALQVDCKDNALKGNDGVAIESGSVVLIARTGDGIKTTNSDVSQKGNQRGNITITGGDILIYAACDGIAAAHDVQINQDAADVTLQIFTDKYSKYSEQVSAVSQNVARQGPLFFGPNGGGMGGPTGGGMGGPNGGQNDGNTDKGDHSTKGITAANAVTIAAGNITVSAYDDGIHADNDGTLESGASPLGNVTVSGGSLTLRSNDDAIHADNNIVISGGSINVVGSHEGIEGKRVTISGGDVSVNSSEDGINGTAKSGTAITISGGKLYIYAGGDGVDSNSTTQYEGIVFSGGTSVIISLGQADSSIDTERGYKYTGGYVIGIGKSGGMSSESKNCQNFGSVGSSATLSLQKDGYLSVAGVATIKMPSSFNALVVCLGKTNASISSATSTSYSLDKNGVYWN